MVTLRRASAILVLLGLPGLALATTFTDTASVGTTFNASASPLGGIAGCDIQPGVHAYAQRTLTIHNTDTYTFEATASTGFSNGSGSDPMLAVYAGSFNPANPTQNLVACNDDRVYGTQLLPYFQANLQAGTTYVIVTTHWIAGATAGSATYNITPDVTLAGAPVLSGVAVTSVTSNGAVLQGTSTSAGTGFYIVQPAALAPPSVAQVLAGQQSNGAAAAAAGSGAVSANTQASFPLASLAPGVAYNAYLVVRDNQAPPLTSVPIGAGFSTTAVAPQPPSIGTATAGNAQATVSFTPPANTGGSAITQYTVTSSPGDITATGSASPIVVTGLSNGTSYTFTVTATNAIGESLASGASNAVTPVGPPALSGFGPFARTYGDAAFEITAPASPSSGAFTYTSSNPAVATVSGTTITIVGAGTTVLTANQAAAGGFTAGSITADLVVARAEPAITGFGDLSVVYGAAPFTLSTPASNSAGAFSYGSSNPAVATVSGNTVTIVGAGTATLTATQAATANFDAGSATAQLTVGAAAPTLSGFGDLAASFGDAPITLVPPASPSAGAFTYTSSDPAVATVAGNVVTIVGAGTATLTAHQAAHGNYAAAATTAQLAVGVATPVLSGFGNLAATFGDAPITLAPPVSPSTGAFTYTSSNPAVATVAGNVVTIVGAGATTLTVTQAAAGNYGTAQTTAQLAVDTQVPALSGFTGISATFGDAPITLVPPASPSVGAFTYSSSNPAVATVAGNVVTIVGSGSAIITAHQAAHGNYAAGSITMPLNVDVAVPVLSGFGNLAATFGDAPITLAPPASPSAGAFTYTSSNPAVATVAGNVVTIVGSGTTTLTALQAGAGDYGSAQVTAQLVVGLATPALTGFGDMRAVYGDGRITLVPPSSPSAGVFTYASSNPAVATVNGSMLTITGAGTAVITVSQVAHGNYGPAHATAQLVVDAGTAQLSGFGDMTATYGDAPFRLVPPVSPSSGAFTYASSDPSIARIDGDMVTVLGTGTVTITAIQAASGNFGASQASARLQVGAGAPVLSGFGDMTARYGDAPITLTPPSSPSKGAFTYTSSDPTVATIVGDVLTIVGPGTATITAIQAADGPYAATQVTAQLSVDATVPELSGFDNLTATPGQQPIVLVAPSSPSTGAFTFTSSDPSVAVIVGNVLTIVGPGTAIITVTQAADGNYAAATVTAELVVSATAPTITGFADLHKMHGEPAFDLADPASDSPGAFTFTIDNAAVATVSGRTVTLVGPGTATITATQAASGIFAAGSVTALLVVSGRPDPTQDAEVVGTLQAQLDTGLRFAQAQQSNVRDRLRQRRDAGAGGTANGLSLSSAGSEGGIALQPRVLAEGAPDRADTGWSLWTGGTVTFGDRGFRTGSEGYDFRSDGITFGADRRLRPNVLLGLALGGGWSDVDVGSHGSRVDARQQALTVYGLWHGTESSVFVDGQLAVGRLDYDLRRWSEVAGTLASAQREGSQFFGSVTFGYDAIEDARRLTTYGRLDAGRTTLDAYRESGLGLYDLQYGRQGVQQRSLAFGIEGSHAIEVTWARAVRPYWQLEYRNDFSARSDAGINYVVAPVEQDYRLALRPWASSNWNLGVGTDFAFGNGVTLTTLVRHEVNVGMGANTTFGVQLSLDFGGDAGAAASPAASQEEAGKTGKRK